MAIVFFIFGGVLGTVAAGIHALALGPSLTGCLTAYFGVALATAALGIAASLAGEAPRRGPARGTVETA
ncbi:hypothetical protein [Roseivivax sp. CAU 1761]